MGLLNSIISWLMKKRMYQMELFLRYPSEVQEEGLIRLITAAKDTEWGKKMGYASITGHAEFQRRVPVQDYESILPYIERLRKGEQNLLWPTEIKWFAKSSGTTSQKSKFIPVSEEALEDCHYQGGIDTFVFYYHNYPGNKIFTDGGRSLVLGGSHRLNPLSGHSSYGDLSAVLIENLPFWAEFMRIPDRSIILMEEFEKKIEKIAAATMRENVTNIAGVPSWMLVLLKHILDKTGKENLLEVWPNLELFIHGGVSFTPYRWLFEKLIPAPAMHYIETYNASEGFFAIQDRTAGGDMLLMLDYGVFYEFIPAEEAESENPRACMISEVEAGRNYAMVISTNGGLWRYRIGDTVEFTTLNPYRIRITGRTKHFINAFGEELIVDNAEKALAVACAQTGARIRDFTAGPVFMDGRQAGAHEWLVEFERPPRSADAFALALDEALKAVNSDYEAKRTGDLTLRKPIVRVMPEGTFYQWLRNKGRLGGQNKVPRLCNDRHIVEEITGIRISAGITGENV